MVYLGEQPVKHGGLYNSSREEQTSHTALCSGF
jgi:hypothetical protein